jgi:hypothetical protein
MRQASFLLAEAASDVARTPWVVVVIAGLVAAAIFVNPWLLAAAAAMFLYHLVLTARAVRFFHSSEGVGWRVHAVGNIARDEALQADLFDLAGALVRAGRVAREVDVFLARNDRRRVERELRELRAVGAAPRADVFGRRLRTLDVLADRREAFDKETHRIDRELPSIRERSFDARIDGRVPDELLAEVAGFAGKAAMLGASLADAYEEARRFEPRAAGRRVRRWLPRRMG